MGCGASTNEEQVVAPTSSTSAPSAPSLDVAPAPASTQPVGAQEDTPVMPKETDVPTAIMEQYMETLFQSADENGDGVLQPEEFERLLSRSGFGFSKDVIEKMIRSADVNSDGVIEYCEFVPCIQQILNTAANSNRVGIEQFAKRKVPTEFESGTGSVLGDWGHNHYQFRIKEAAEAEFIGSTFFFPHELEVRGTIIGDGTLRFILDSPAFGDMGSSSIWNLRSVDDCLAGEVFRSGCPEPTEIKLQRMASGSSLKAPCKDEDVGAGKADRILKYEMACDKGKRAIPL